ncbi:methyl-accepting chemotaxis protein [Leucothrix pacifica]|uniref:Methyl-accepting chemotaxis protein n=1 Tax=Leucothrix pacifica TaxID=1247513 RepID=A0A317C7M9_9GAMM|nr:HAMP domain-containing methyl-accepting chemotaxis protein [Leucothrix pacifica]PWQ94339.1 methyl-accepting chemotaxis protein [Leucothrix pacifica]
MSKNSTSPQSQRAVQGGIMSIRSRVALSITAPLVILLVVSVMSLLTLMKSSSTLIELNEVNAKVLETTEIKSLIQEDFLGQLNYIKSATLKPDRGLTKLIIKRQELEKVWPGYIASVESDDKAVAEELISGKAHFDTRLDELMAILTEESPDTYQKFFEATRYHIFADRSATGFPLDVISHLGNPLITALEKRIESNKINNQTAFEEAKNSIDLATATIATVILLGLIFIMMSGVLLYSSIARPVNHLTQVVNSMSAGDTTARSRLRGNDELTHLGNAFNRMVDDSTQLQEQVNRDNDAINHSVFSLLEAVSDLSERDLTVRAQVTEDATGPLADAINQLAEDTTEVLDQVKTIASSVEETSTIVNERSQSVNVLAKEEQAEAQETANQIERIRRRLEIIAQSALQTNDMAGKTSGTTQDAYQSVSRSMGSMNEIRNTVQDTGKRIKRLGERSQEISYITDIINGIAERTTVLALNANMQAMAAGEAGKGFSVIADEIQRLAESSRESTEQISTLVKNIQKETKSTIATMDHTIEQVVEGSALADEATRQMQETLDATNQLTSSVNDIANASKEQMEMSETLQSSATRIMESTTATGKEMNLLAQLTNDMTDYAKQLVESVNVFKLKP